MTLIKSPETKSLDFLFRNHRFSVPDLQRNYDWSTYELNKFWLDSDNAYKNDIPEYFFGPMVFVEKNPGDIRKIIDGQQRLISTSILAAVARDICHSTKHQNLGAVSELNDLLFSRKSYQGQPQSDVLILNDNNQLYYKNFVLKEDDPDNKLSAIQPSNEYDKKIYSAYKFFKKKFDEYGKIQNLSQFVPLFLEKVMRSFLVIEIIVDSEEAGHRVFETLNYRGLDLSIASLVKNYLLEKSKDSDLRTNLQKWKEITNSVDSKTMDDFLKHHWMAHYGMVTPSNLFDKTITKIDYSSKVNAFLDDLVTDARIYRQLRNPDSSYWYGDQEIVEYLEDLNDLRNDSAQPLLLIAKRAWNDKKKIKELTRICSIIHFRAKSIGNRTAADMVKTMVLVAGQIRDKKEKYTIDDVKKEFAKIDISGEEFQTNFRENEFSGKEASYVLRKIETHNNGSYAVKRTRVNVTLEHILPQNLDGEWTKDFTDDTHARCVNLIGNLTILHDVLNKRGQDNSFKDKKLEYAKQKDVTMTLTVAKMKQWREKEIRYRTIEFTGLASVIWKL